MCLRHTRTVMMKKTGYFAKRYAMAEVPDETQLAQIRNYLAGKHKKTVGAGIRKKTELIAGFVLARETSKRISASGDGLTDYNRN